MNYRTEELLTYKPQLPFCEQPKKLESHYTSLIKPMLETYYTNDEYKLYLIGFYRKTIRYTLEAIEDEFKLKITSGELMSVLLQHPYFQSRWLSPRYCRDFGDCPLSFQDLFASGIQNGLHPKWVGTLDVNNFVTLGMVNGKFNTTKELKTFIEKELLKTIP